MRKDIRADYDNILISRFHQKTLRLVANYARIIEDVMCMICNYQLPELHTGANRQTAMVIFFS
jgi:hypothetical protein